MKRIFSLLRHTLIGAILTIVLGVLTNIGLAQGKNSILRLATTTSTDNSGLLDQLLPHFKADTGYSVQVISVGTGKALRMGEAGDVDVLLVHAPASEDKFIALGYGINRRNVMANDFIVVGPKSDPAGLLNAESAMDAFTKLRQNKTLFVSRGDDSGTHKKELSIWNLAGIDSRGTWYREVGQGMGKSLQIAEELQAYLLIDRGTWIFLEDKTSLKLLYQGDEILYNPYGVIAINPERHKVNFAGAMAFINWITSKSGQADINSYTLNGTRLFTPTVE